MSRPAALRFFTPPVFSSEEGTQRARIFFRIVTTTVIVATIAMTALMLVQPGLRSRAAVVIVSVDSLCLGLLQVCRTGRTRLASWLIVAGLVVIVTLLAFTAGGIHSPAVNMYFIFVLVAGLLLGQSAAIRTALTCASLAAGLVWIQELGWLPAQTANYGPPALLLLNWLYMGVVISLLHLATDSIQAALQRAETELAERREAEAKRELSEQRRAMLESQLLQAQKMEALGRLAGGIAHDFNNILTAIGTNVELARADVQDPQVQGCLDEVTRAHVRARDLVKQILLFSRQQEAVRTVVHLRPLVEEALKLLRASLPTSIEVVAKYADDLPPVSADASQIHQIVMNLGTNAEHAMLEHGGVLSIALDQVIVGESSGTPAVDLKPGVYVRASFGDDGVGMSPEVQGRIFEPFFTTKGLDGTGLGLSVVHGIMRDHDGAVRVTSELGNGSKFELYFPAASERIAEMPVAPSGVMAGAGEHIMYVDDEAPLVSVMTRVFTRLGYRCTGFSNATDALVALRADPLAFHAIVTDLMMPGMTGLEFAREVVDIRKDLPIAVVSGYARSETIPSEVRLSAWIHKPPTIEEMSRAVHAMLHPVS